MYISVAERERKVHEKRFSNANIFSICFAVDSLYREFHDFIDTYKSTNNPSETIQTLITMRKTVIEFKSRGTSCNNNNN